MLIKEQWGIQNAPFYDYFSAYKKNAFLVIIVNFCDRNFWEHVLNYNQYIVSDKKKHFRFELDKAESLIKIWPNGK